MTYLFTRTVSIIERIIDDEALMTHQQISEQVMQSFADAEAIKHYADNGVIRRRDYML